MNYLAHVHLAKLTDTSLVGNFLGDFVKGSDLSELATPIRKGIQLHRKIDTFTDSHTELKYLREGFPKGIRRMAGVALDVYLDHLLLLHWEGLSSCDLDGTLEEFYLALEDTQLDNNPRFERVREGLIRHRWLTDYKHRSTCLRAFEVIEKRLKGRVQFAQQAYAFVADQHTEIERVFLRFYPQLIDYAKTVEKELNNP